MAAPESGFGRIDVAQTFTVGVEGRLYGVELFAQQLESFGTFTFDIRPTSYGVPLEDNAAALARVTVDWTHLPSRLSSDPVNLDSGYVYIDLNRFQLQVRPGDVLAIVLSAEDGAVANVNGNIGNPYSAGRAFARYGRGGNSFSSVHSWPADFELAFQVHIR